MTRARPSTLSRVAFDPKTKEFGVAVESKFVAVGAVVPFAAARVGAVATQAYANTAYGPDALAMLKRGIAPKDVVKKLVTSDEDAAQRQVGVVDARGRAASYTGKECFPWAGHVVGRNFAAQGNILAGEEVLKALARAFEVTKGDLPVRLLAALSAGQRAGGDKRGQQSAAILVVRHGGGYAGFDDRWIDIRVDGHPARVADPSRIWAIRSGVSNGSPRRTTKSASLPDSRVPFSGSSNAAYAPPDVAARIASSGERRWSSKNPFTAQWTPKRGPYGMPSEPKHSGM